MEYDYSDTVLADIATTKEYNIIRNHNDKLITDFEKQIPVTLLPKFKNIIEALSAESIYMQTEIFNRVRK